jgi:hypothetical protein
MKRSKICISVFFGILMIPAATAQIIYTNITDVKLCAGSCTRSVTGLGGISPGSSYFLDLDSQDGADFKISAIGQGIWGSLISLHLKVIPLNGNKINAIHRLPLALRKNSVISNASDWSGDSCTFLTLCLANVFGCSEDTISEWKSGKEAYLGVSILKNDIPHYGWVRLVLTYNASQVTCTIRDYAYQDSPDQPIKAGTVPTQNGPVSTMQKGSINPMEKSCNCDVVIAPNSSAVRNYKNLKLTK